MGIPLAGCATSNTSCDQRTTTVGSWRPILEGPLAERALATVLAIADCLQTILSELSGVIVEQQRYPIHEKAPLAGGNAGLAIFYAYWHLAHSGTGAADRAVQCLEAAFDTMPQLAAWPALYSGFTGVAWATAHLQRYFFDPDEESIDASLDEALLAYLNQTPWPHEYDLISGLVGYGLYALDRLPRPTALACLEQVIDHLSTLAEPRAG